jgi:predicted membrane protein
LVAPNNIEKWLNLDIYFHYLYFFFYRYQKKKKKKKKIKKKKKKKKIKKRSWRNFGSGSSTQKLYTLSHDMP